MFEPVIRWQHRCMRTGALDDLSELRRASYFILGFGGSTRLIRIETVSLELQEYLVDLCVHGMQVLNRDVAKNALVCAEVCTLTPFDQALTPSFSYSLAYHLFMPRYDLSPEHAAASLQFLRARAPTILDAVWNVITDGQHGNCKASRSLFDAYVADRAYFTGYENQAPVIVKIWELIVSVRPLGSCSLESPELTWSISCSVKYLCTTAGTMQPPQTRRGFGIDSPRCWSARFLSCSSTSL